MLPVPSSSALLNFASSPLYAVGTFQNDYRMMAILFGWLLRSDFVFGFFEHNFGKFMPLYLKEDLHECLADSMKIKGFAIGAV